MMRTRLANEFKRDLKKAKKRGKELGKLNEIICQLLDGKKLDKKYRAHKLQGNYSGKMECHIEPDWLLIYEIQDEFLILYRTGSHSDLFE